MEPVHNRHNKHLTNKKRSSVYEVFPVSENQMKKPTQLQINSFCYNKLLETQEVSGATPQFIH